MEQREVHRRVAYVGGGTPTRMRSNAVGGGTRTLCLAWEVAIMMPLQYKDLQMRYEKNHLQWPNVERTFFDCHASFLTGKSRGEWFAHL